VPSDDIPDLVNLAAASIQAIGCDFGCFRTEIKVTPEGHKIIEVNSRPTRLTPATVKLASGLSLLPLSMRLALGEHVVVDGPLSCCRVAYRYYCEPPMSAERVVTVAGLDKLRELPGVLQIDVHKGAPGTVADYAELAEHYRACTEDVVVTYEHRG
jgi:hypothetical protein